MKGYSTEMSFCRGPLGMPRTRTQCASAVGDRIPGFNRTIETLALVKARDGAGWMHSDCV